MKTKFFLVICLTSAVAFGTMKTRPQVLVFTASWCPPCRQLHRAIEREKRKGYNKVKFKYVDFDTEKDLVEKFQIKSIPTTIYKDKRKIGFSTAKEYFRWIRENVEQ